MEQNSKNEPDKLQSYFRLLKYARPYWFRLTIGIVAGMLVGGSLFVSLMLIPQLVGVVDSTDAPGNVNSKEIAGDPVAVELVETLEQPGLTRQERIQAIEGILHPPEKDPQLTKLLNQARSAAEKYHLPLQVSGRNITVTWPVSFTFEAVSPEGIVAWQIFALYGALFVLAWLIKNVATYINHYYTQWVGAKVVADLREEIFKKLINQSMSFFGKMDVGHLISQCTNDTAAIESSISNSVADLTSAPIQIFACLAAVIIACHQYDSYLLMVILLCGMPVVVLPVHILGRRIRKVYKKSFAKIAEVFSRMHEVFTGIRVVKAYHTEDLEEIRFNQVNRKYLIQVVRALRLQLLISPAMEVVAIAATLVFLVFSYSQGITITQLVALLAPAFMAYQPIKALSKVVASLQRSMAAADRYFRVIDTDTSLPEKPNAITLTEFKDKIELDQVEFSYDERAIIDNVSFTIPKGHMIAVVGETGSGKTTLANLIARFYDVTKGAVRIDGVDVRDYSIDSLRKMIGVVNQDALLFNETIANNIAYGRPEATRQEIIEAAKLANAHEFIVDGRHPDGYDTQVGEKGFKLSGGEKQRIAIARAILRNPPILLLDEATSALDTVTEKLVQEALNKVMSNRTVFAIAHRLSTIRNADMIVVLHHGKVAECGNHQELLARNGIYRKLHDTQFAMYN